MRRCISALNSNAAFCLFARPGIRELGRRWKVLRELRKDVRRIGGMREGMRHDVNGMNADEEGWCGMGDTRWMRDVREGMKLMALSGEF